MDTELGWNGNLAAMVPACDHLAENTDGEQAWTPRYTNCHDLERPRSYGSAGRATRPGLGSGRGSGRLPGNSY